LKLPLAFLLCASALFAQSPKPETSEAYDCYVASAEARMRSAAAFLAADSRAELRDQMVRGRKVVTFPANGSNPHKVPGGLLYDWIGAVFVPGVTLERTVRMLQDYDHRARYFSEMVSASKLLCRTGDRHFGSSLTMKEPATIETDADVVWEQVDPHRWTLRSFSTRVHEVGGQHNYLLRVNSFWRFAETPQGVFVQAEYITLSGEFGSLLRALGSIAGINPEKSLRKTLDQMRESLLNAQLEPARPPEGLPACGEPYRVPACPSTASR
jgi:hypothetical protein